MKERRENAVASKDFGAVRAGNIYTLVFENGLDNDGEQNVGVYECWTGKYLCRMRASSFSILSEEL